ncbi:MAG: hypothetical protein J6P40_07310 [Oscillospiraceae bacterium]|nr:hypothetical protein [Oscillospiraceae bacterium]
MRSIKVTNTMYDCVKFMADGKGTIEEIARYFGISKSTVSRIKSSQTYREYQETVSADMYMKRKKEKEEAAAKAKAEEEAKAKALLAAQQQEKPILTDMQMPGGALSANYQMNRMYEAVKAQNELLKLISNKLAFIVDDLTK